MLSLQNQSTAEIFNPRLLSKYVRLSDKATASVYVMVHGFPLTAPVVVDIPRVAPTQREGEEVTAFFRKGIKKLNPQQGDLKLSDPPPGQGAGGGLEPATEGYHRCPDQN
ncbi:hypothetical protein PoB_007012900 [Plakobranchus ocellatus]|uniref:Uncharacterized protein n=1 Tax=Plakobranchus ocellatus TaxID=259542 RepID=A0AAV4DHA7_9GAST|nr:hypothetical protein PoB_007012900 [Plakobranchus ocellatus]